MAAPSSNVTHVQLFYQEVTALRLLLVTAAGIPLEALGTREGKTQVLASLFYTFFFCKGDLATKSGWNSGQTLIRLHRVLL